MPALLPAHCDDVRDVLPGLQAHVGLRTPRPGAARDFVVGDEAFGRIHPQRGQVPPDRAFVFAMRVDEAGNQDDVRANVFAEGDDGVVVRVMEAQGAQVLQRWVFAPDAIQQRQVRS